MKERAVAITKGKYMAARYWLYAAVCAILIMVNVLVSLGAINA